jgi:proteasome lid subunit RPN8/RPN11
MRWREQSVDLPSSPWNGPNDDFFVIVGKACLTHVRQQLGSNPQEQGGLLLGRLLHLDKPPGGRTIVAVCVDSAVHATEGIGTEVSLSMPASVWQEANRLRRSDQVIVGWYHSHPNIGAFFSSTDLATQAAFFQNDWSLGWVIDPIRGEQAWFKGANSTAVTARQLRQELL